MRIVVLLCGPPGAGKTTAAHQSGMTVFDRDDPRWISEKQFTQALERLAALPRARAVVIRSAPSTQARRRWSRLVGATHTRLMLEPRDVLVERIVRRGRADKAATIAGLDTWFDRFDRADGVPLFSDWGEVLGTSLGRVSARFA